MSEFNIGLIGAGHIGAVHANAIHAMTPPGIRLDSIADKDMTRAINLADQFGAAPVDLIDACQTRNMNCAVIATPPSVREDLLYPLISRGIPVLCEKPVALNCTIARRLSSNIQHHNSPFFVSSKLLFTSGCQAAQKFIKSGQPGTLRHLDISFQRKMDISGDWRANPDIGGGGIVADVGPQTIDLVRGLIGEPIAVKATADKRGGFDVEDDARILFTTKSGATAECLLSWCQTDTSNAYATLRADQATLELGWQKDRYQTNDGKWHRLGDGYNQAQAFSAQLSWFIDAIRTGNPPQSNLADALNTARIIAAAYQSIASGNWIDLPSDQN